MNNITVFHLLIYLLLKILQDTKDEIEKLKTAHKELNNKKDEISDTSSQLTKVVDEPLLEEKVKDLNERYEILQTAFKDKHDQVRMLKMT